MITSLPPQSSEPPLSKTPFRTILTLLISTVFIISLPAQPELQIAEIFSGQSGPDLTADWFEIVNTGDASWISGVDADLYYDDESMNPLDATIITGISEIAPGQAAVVLIGDQGDSSEFINIWGPVIELAGVGIGYTDGAGLSGGGDLVTLWLGDANTTNPVDTASYPDTEFNDGQSFDVDLGAFSEVGNANGAVATIAGGGDNMDVPNIASPGNGMAIEIQAVLKITEIFPGQAGADLTADWFEITNTGSAAWVLGSDGDLYYDDESMDPLDATLISGIREIRPGGIAIVLIGVQGDSTEFSNTWSPVIDLSEVEIGYTDGAGLSGGGDLVTLWLGDANTSNPIDTASYPDTEFNDGQSFDLDLGAFSEVGNANGAVATLAGGGDNMDVSNIGSPGNGKAIPLVQGLVITEIFSGQAGDDLTADWFEIINQGDEAWVSGTHPDLYYDDESMDPLEATLIEGIGQIDPGHAAIVVIGTDTDASEFFDIWSVVIDLDGVDIGYTDGAGLGGGGDLVTLWAGDPARFVPVDTASYPDTDFNDGQSYDVSLLAFSEVGNANNAVATIALGGDNMDVPNIGSPGNQDPVSSLAQVDYSQAIDVYPNPGAGRYHLSMADGGGLLAASVYDLTGSQLYQETYGGETQAVLELPPLASGMYVVQLELDKGVALLRLVKE
jgi:hypothetical protein